MATLREAIITHLREDTGAGSLVEKLGNDATRIKPRGFITADGTFPQVGVEMAHTTGMSSARPHSNQVVHVYVYTRSEASNVRDWITIDEVIGLVIPRLNSVEPDDFSLTVDEDFKPWEVAFDGFVSRDLFDEVIRADYRWIRFRVFGLRTSTQV